MSPWLSVSGCLAHCPPLTHINGQHTSYSALIYGPQDDERCHATWHRYRTKLKLHWHSLPATAYKYFAKSYLKFWSLCIKCCLIASDIKHHFLINTDSERQPPSESYTFFMFTLPPKHGESLLSSIRLP